MSSENYTAIILAGGDSRRMGSPKALLNIGNKLLIENIVDSLKPYFSEILISANHKNLYEFLELPIIEDEIKDQGPIMGIYSGLKASKNNVNFIITSDITVVDIDSIKRLLEYKDNYDVIIPSNNGKLEPLFAIYTKQTIPYIEKVLQTKSRRIISIIEFSKTKILPLDMSWYININTKKDFKEVKEKFNHLSD